MNALQREHADLSRRAAWRGKTMQEITNRIRQAGRTMQLEVMQGAWVSDMLLDAGRHVLS